ncbi:ABC transporter ATP-binding protein [Herbiconiux sp. L3-i23]|uniref:oligopeptide/dipeptide ABC transporter ATP-binding protein n=1 Tax=Herbiconiux sp. L3-i23 TaxID=2905871 RepID=UPI0020483BC3|nr:ABC transporter ATP-binding protein [Herbiconiux sp. L3-i23]BDI21867.1 peptide ABC transporter ATP-binding protein [Herbiconiux sp. L3-i23]
MPVLEADDVVVQYSRGRHHVRAVAGVTLTVDAGEIVGLVGESGCGKSSLGRAIVGLEQLAEGTVTLNGHPVTRIGRRARAARDRSLQMVFQDPYTSLNPRRRIWKQIADGFRERRRPAEARAAVLELLDAVGLPASSADRFPHEFSGGQRQRIAIARALAADPEVIVADEAISALDASTRAQVTNLLVRLARERRLGLLFISHDLSVVRHIADRVCVMYLGRIVEEGPTELVWERRLHPYTDALVRAIPTVGADAPRPEAPRGEVPDPAAPPAGCRFHPRCPFAREICTVEDQALRPIDSGQSAACVLQPTGGPAVALPDPVLRAG